MQNIDYKLCYENYTSQGGVVIQTIDDYINLVDDLYRYGFYNFWSSMNEYYDKNIGVIKSEYNYYNLDLINEDISYFYKSINSILLNIEIPTSTVLGERYNVYKMSGKLFNDLDSYKNYILRLWEYSHLDLDRTIYDFLVDFWRLCCSIDHGLVPIDEYLVFLNSIDSILLGDFK